MYLVKFSPVAENDLKNNIDYISSVLKSPEAADDLLEKLENTLRNISNNPYVISLVRDDYLASIGYRLITVKNYLVFFMVKENEKEISVIRFIYGRRNWINFLTEENPGTSST